MISQKLAEHCMEIDNRHAVENRSITWVGRTVSTLNTVRAKLWPILEPLGTICTSGAFYFLVPVPIKVRAETNRLQTELPVIRIFADSPAHFASCLI